MQIALLYDGTCTFVEELLNYDLTFIIYDVNYADTLIKYNKPIKMLKYDDTYYDIAIATSNDVENIRASKKVVIGKVDNQKKRISYLDTFNIDDVLKEREKANYKFSIIVPNYNNADWIGCTINSVIKQTYDNWEMYIIDDMSTDNSIDVINAFKDKRITLIQNPIKLYNGGSRNMGILKAKESNPDGYLLFIDSDDWLANNDVLARLNKFIEDEDLITLDYACYMNNVVKRNYKHSYKNIDDLFMTYGAMCAVWCKCFKVSIAPLFEFNTLMEDRNYHYKLVNAIKSYANFGETTHIWNKMNNKSITTDKDQLYGGGIQTKLVWDNCAYRHIAGMLDLLNEITNSKWRSFINQKIDSCKNKVANGIYEQF